MGVQAYEPNTDLFTRDIFKPRTAIKPYEYPELIEYVDAIRHSYWLHSEFNYNPDIQDMKVNLEPHEVEAINRAMIAISQVECAVKTFWGKMHEHLPKPEIAKVGATFSDCHSEGTEILTPSGWVDFRNIREGDIVLQYDDYKGTLEPATTQAVTQKYFEGDLYGIRLGFSTYAEITPTHRLVYYTQNKDPVVTDAETFVNRLPVSKKFPQAATLEGVGRKCLTPKEQLLIALQADGNKRHWLNSKGERIPRGLESFGAEYDIKLKKDRKKERLEAILEQCDSDEVLWTKAENLTREGYVTYTIRIDNAWDYKRFEWVNLFDKTSDWCEEFIQELAEWDGSKLPNKKDCKIKYFTTDKGVADLVQVVGVCAGYRCHLNSYEDQRLDSFGEAYGKQYTVSFVANREKVTINRQGVYVEKIPYSGWVYCVTVPSGSIVTRKNDKTFIGKNSEARHEDAYSELIERLGLNEEFEAMLEKPALRDRMEYLKKINSQARAEDPKAYFKAIILFSMFIENVSLFSQFFILMSFNKHKNVLKGISNAVEATSKEERTHALFGFDVVNIIKEENPGWFNEDLVDYIYVMADKALQAEIKVLNWIYEAGDLGAAPYEVTLEYIKKRLCDSLWAIGVEPRLRHRPRPEILERTKWFDDEITVTKSNDFFQKRSTNYTKRATPITEEDLF